MPRKSLRRRRRRSSKKSKRIRGGVTAPKLTNETIRRAVRDYLNGGARKQRVVTKYGDISNWDTSSVTNMNHMFHYAESFNQPLNKWNVSKVTNMCSMFSSASSFNQPINNRNVSKEKN